METQSIIGLQARARVERLALGRVLTPTERLLARRQAALEELARVEAALDAIADHNPVSFTGYSRRGRGRLRS